MGLITGILSAPIVAPARGLLFVFEKIAEAVDAEMWDEGRLEGELMKLSLQLDFGEITEQQYHAEEERILERLTEVREHNEALAAQGSTRGRSRRSSGRSRT